MAVSDAFVEGGESYSRRLPLILIIYSKSVFDCSNKVYVGVSECLSIKNLQHIHGFDVASVLTVDVEVSKNFVKVDIEDVLGLLFVLKLLLD